MEKVDPNGRTWAIIKANIEKRLQQLNTQLTDPNNGRAADLVLKGRINELRQMLTMGKPPPEMNRERNGEPRR